MGETDFYKLLGLARSASADQIKAAYRESVKKHHPDLFSAFNDKAQATEELRLINEAYRVLGNPERRRRYDEEFAQKQRKRTAAAARRRATSGRQAKVRRKTLKLPRLRLHFAKKWAGYSLAAAMGILVLVYAGSTEPKVAVAWTLWERLEVLPPQRDSSTRETPEGWVRLGEHASVKECATVLRAMVRDDERTGSRAVFDEKSGTMAITVHVKNEGARKDEDQVSRQEGMETAPTTGTTKRVRNLECRATQRLESESWFRRALRGAG